MKILHTISSLDPKSGGPSRSVPGLCSGLMHNDVSVALAEINSCSDDGINRQGWPAYVRSNADQRAGDFFNFLIDSEKPDLIHDHGVWMVNNHIVARRTVRCRKPLVIAPRGMLEPWSLATKKWKKKLAMLLYQRRDLRSATALHATAEAEALQLRKLGFKQPIIISPNGVTLPQTMPEKKRRKDNKRVVLFVSRIHPKKGILELIEAWAKLKGDPSFKSIIDRWHIELAGPDYDNHLEVVKDRIKSLNVAEDFTYLGNLDDSEKWVAYRRADLFVLPTYSENFGIVVPEALAAGVPVITTKGAPWAELLGECENARMRECESVETSSFNALPQSGWWIDIGVEPLVQALQEAMSLSDTERTQMGQNGRKLVAERYAWNAIAKEMGAAYEWILHGGEKPECVKVT